MNVELGRIRKEAFLANLCTILAFAWKWKSPKSSLRIAGVPVEIRTKHLERYCHAISPIDRQINN
jgi:hypothetical protein